MSNTRHVKEFEADPEYRELMDSGKRISDIFAMHRLADPIGNLGHFFAVRLSDGTTNNNLYPSMGAARGDIARRDDEDRWMYIQVVPSTLTQRDAALLLRAQRKMYDAGIRVSAMDGRVMIPRIAREDHMAQLRGLFRGQPPSNITHGRGN